MANIRDIKKRVIISLLTRIYNNQPRFHLELFIEEAAEEIVKLLEELSTEV